MEPYLRANRLGTWTYLRTPLGQPDADGSTYVRVAESARLKEGLFVEREFLPLETYLQRPGSPPGPQERQRPQAPVQGGSAFMFELTTPLEPMPADLQPGAPQTDS